jgi:tetratricopeptide (TPR) repeat protein
MKTNPTPRRLTPPLTRSRLIVLAASAVLCGALVFGLFQHFRKPLLPIPIPKDLERLEPQLRAHLTEEIARVKAAPRDASRHATLGLAYAANGLWPEAQKAFLNAVQLDPLEPLAHLYSAVSFQELGAADEAIKRLRELTVNFPSFAPGFYRLGDALTRTGAFDEAAAAFQRLTELAPTEWRGFAGLGECRLRQGKADQAANLFQKALSLAPREKLPHHLLGQAWQKLGRTNDAARELRVGLDAPHYPMPDAWSVQAPQHMKQLQDQMDMAREYTEAGVPAKAVQLLAAALEFSPTNLSLLSNLGIALNQAGQPQQAKTVLLKAIAIDAHYLPAQVAISVTCLALGQKDEAMYHADRAIALGPNNAFPHVTKANVLLALERDLDALAELEAAARCDPANAQLPMEMGDICLRNLDRPAEALDHYHRASQLDPTFFPAQIRLADLNLRLGNTNEAQSALLAARALAPNDPAVTALQRRLPPKNGVAPEK